MLTKPAKRPVSALVVRKFSDFRTEEEGGITIFVIFMFVLMILFGGIAVDVMRYEWRRVTMQETMDRAMLAAANLVLPKEQTPQSVAQNWFDVAGLGDELTVDFSAPVLKGEATSSSRWVSGTAKVRSYNHFMHMMDIPWFEGPVASGANQGVSKIEVILVLDVTGSMGESSGSTTKIAALRTAAKKFVDVLKFSQDPVTLKYTVPKDPNNLISIGMVPYSSNVNIPVDLRNQYNFTDLANWFDQPAGTGVPNINCFEIPPSTFGSTGLSQTDPISMAAVADTTYNRSGASTTTSDSGGTVDLRYASPVGPNMGSNNVVCNQGATYPTGNMVLLPTTTAKTVTDQIDLLRPRGFTSIAVGMRWGTALIDETARPIYTALRSGVAGMAGRPVANNDADTRKIIVLMTDGDHWLTKHVYAFKSGPSPIYKGSDGNYAIRYTSGGPALTGGTRPFMPTSTKTCSGWTLSADREYFVPHLKRREVAQKNKASEAEGAGTGSVVTGACDPLAWKSTPSWSPTVSVRRLDWSEVWRYVTVDWMVRQLYMRSGVSGTGDYNTVYNTFVQDYLVSEPNMDSLLNQNCTAAKTAGFEVFGIILGDAVIETPVKNCSSPGTGYYYKVKTGDELTSVFEQIAVLISELKLTQ